MGLKETVAGAVKAGFVALGNLPEAVTYQTFKSTSIYEASTGIVTRQETVTRLAGLFTDYTKQEIDGQQIHPHDRKFLFQQADLAGRPTLQDRLTRRDGTSWEVVFVKEDPAHATWELQVRALNG